MDFSKKAQEYVQSKKLAWSEATIRSEGYRLRATPWELFEDPEAVYEALAKATKPYALKTMFIRLTDFYEWLAIGPNIYRRFMKENARLFKNAYKKRKVDVDFEGTLAKIRLVQRSESREKAFFDLRAQADKVEGSEIVGKGGFRRPLFTTDKTAPKAYPFSYSTYLQDLRSVGLRPHDLRKVFANKLLRSGLSLTDIMAAGGWRSLQSVEKYLQELETSQLATKVAEVMAG